MRLEGESLENELSFCNTGESLDDPSNIGGPAVFSGVLAIVLKETNKVKKLQRLKESH